MPTVTMTMRGSLEQVPETGRWRFMDISPKYETMVCQSLAPSVRGVHAVVCVELAEASYQSLMQEFEGKVLPPNHPLTRHIRRVAKSILEASNLGTLDTPEVGRPKGSEQSWSFSGSPQDMPPKVGGAKKWRLFVVNDDSVVNAMAAYGQLSGLSVAVAA